MSLLVHCPCFIIFPFVPLIPLAFKMFFLSPISIIVLYSLCWFLKINSYTYSIYIIYNIYLYVLYILHIIS